MSTQNAKHYYSQSEQQALRNMPSKSYIMISYSWANKEDVNVIIEKLSPYLRIWRDINSLSGSSDLWNTIAIAVQEAEFFIPIISTEYEKSDSCTNELNFALNNKQIVVPIFLNPDFRPTGNVGLRISKLYYMAFQQVVECPFTLIKHLNTMGANHSSVSGDKDYQIKSLKVPIQSILSPVNNPSRNMSNSSYRQTSKHNTSSSRTLEPTSKSNGFNIRQKTADQTQFDIYSSDKDDSFSYQCSGKFVSIADFDYISCDELNKTSSSQPTNDPTYSAVSQLIFENVKYFFNCFVLLNEESLLLAAESGQIYHLVLNNQEQNYYTYNLDVRFNRNDLDLYKREVKVLVDMCLDSAGHLIVLTRNKLNSDQTRPLYSYSVELFGLTYTNGIQLAYRETLFVLNNEGMTQQQQKRSNDLNKTNIESQCLFTRIYSVENANEKSLILIDNAANKRILWYKKSSGAKIRCIKPVENNLEDLKSFVTIDENNQIFLCAKAGLFCLKRSSSQLGNRQKCRIKHFDSLKACVDICYDTSENSLIFVDSNSVYRGKFYEEKTSKDSVDLNNNDFKSEVSEPLLKYKQLFSNSNRSDRDHFKRVLLCKNQVFILTNGDNVHRKNSVFVIDTQKLETTNSLQRA